jgi:hypothetical protein
MKLFRTKEWYMQRIVKFILNMTSYSGDWCRGYHHEYDIHIQDVIPNFVIFTMISDNGDLSFYGYDLLSRTQITIKAEEHLTRKTAKQIYCILKNINIFK